MAYDIDARTAQIERELERLDPAPFRRVLSRLLQSLETSTIGRLPYDKKVKAAKDLSMLIGYATPSVVINQNQLVVEKLSDVELLRELTAARQALASVMPSEGSALAGTVLASPPGGTGGVGAPETSPVYVEGLLPAHKTSGEVYDIDMAARPPANPPAAQAAETSTVRPTASAGERGPSPANLPGETAAPRKETMAERLARRLAEQEAREAEKAGAPAAGSARPPGRGKAKKNG